MNDLPAETKNALVSIIDELLLDTSLKASEITLYTLVNSNRSFTMELFSQNIEEYLYLLIAQRITTSFSARLEMSIVKICDILIQSQGGLILNYPKPYDIKFKLKNGEEYWIEIASVDKQNQFDKSTIIEHKEKAESQGKIFKLCRYNEDDNQPKEDYQLNGNDFWELIAGSKNARNEIFNLLNGYAKKLSISSIVKETQNRLIIEWRRQD